MTEIIVLGRPGTPDMQKRSWQARARMALAGPEIKPTNSTEILMSDQKVWSVNYSPTTAVYRWAGAVLLVAVLLRLALWGLYSPVTYSDTPSYYRSAQAVRDGFTSYDGTRTPGYPLFLAFFDSDQHVWLAQMGLGDAITMLFFYLGLRLSGQAWFGGLVALAHTLNLGQLFFEANLLTETLTTFWIVLTLTGLHACRVA